MCRSPNWFQPALMLATLATLFACKTGTEAESAVKDAVEQNPSDRTPPGYSPLDIAGCRAATGSLLDHVGAVADFYIDASAPNDPATACDFAVKFERTLHEAPPLERALVDADLRVFVSSAGHLSFDGANRRLFVPRALVNQAIPLMEAVFGVRPSPTVNSPFYFAGSKLFWRMFGGRHSFSRAKAACSSLGPEWKLPTADQVRVVAKQMTEEVMAMLGPGSTITTQFYLESADGSCTEVPDVLVRKCRGNEKIAVCVFDGSRFSGVGPG